MRLLRILTWNTHGSYLYYLSQLPHELYIMTKPGRPRGYGGRCADRAWGPNVHEIEVNAARHAQFDCILFQHPMQYLEDQYLYLSAAQRALPQIFLEHEPPRVNPTETRHPVDDKNVLLIHVTPYNQLMWDNRHQSSRLIEHGVPVPAEVHYTGERASGLVVAHCLGRRGRGGGADIFRQVADSVELELVGLESRAFGGLGEIAHAKLPAFAAQFRFLFSPLRYTGLNLAVIEAMMIGMPVIGLATTEMASVIQNGVSGFVDTDIHKLIAHMHALLRDPHYALALGRGAQRHACERFGMRRFLAEWNAALQLVTDTRAHKTRTLSSVT